MTDTPPPTEPTPGADAPSPLPESPAPTAAAPVEPAQQDAGAPTEANTNAELEAALAGGDLDQMVEQSLTEPSAETETAEGEDEPVISQDFRRGRVAAIRGDDVFIDLMTPLADGRKLQGVVPLTQFERPPRIGAVMDYLVDRVAEDEGLVHLNREGAVQHSTWERIERGTIVEARVMATNKGGLELEMPGNIRAFMPASQVDLHHVDDLEQFVGQKIEARVHEVDRKHKRVIISRREHLHRQRELNKARLMSELEEGQVRDGVVTKLMDFGAFVDLGGVDGLVHVTDLSYSHVGKPAEVVKQGDSVRVKVLKIDKAKDRISLGLKQVAPDPWETFSAQPGEDVSGRITRTANFGAFVEISEGIEGLLPMSEMSWKRIGKAEDVVQTGEVVQLKVLTVDAAKKKLTLSLKQAQGDPWADAEGDFSKGAVVEGKIVSTTDFGAFVELKPGLEGMVHISELAPRRVDAVTDVVQVGQTHKFRVIGIDPKNHKIKLSIKQVDKPVEERKRPKQEHHQAPPKRAPRKDLKGGMDSPTLGMGLGDLKL